MGRVGARLAEAGLAAVVTLRVVDEAEKVLAVEPVEARFVSFATVAVAGLRSAP